jgi:hypothetical protein
MDAWESGLFDDDLAADVRGDWVDEVAGSVALAAAFWIALAALQLRAGALEVDVRDRAVRSIGRGEDLDRWEQGPFGLERDADEDARDEVADRRHVTAALRARLLRAPVVDGAPGGVHRA